MCEEFGGYPKDAIRQIDADDFGLIFDILELRAFAQAHANLDAAARANQEVTPTPMMRRVIRLQYERQQQRGAPEA